MRHLWSAGVLLGLVACGGGVDNLDPTADEDGDGFSNGEELALGSDPMNASDVPYAGGWAKDASCRHDIEATGNDAGQIAEDFVLVDQFGEDWHLHDFCNRVVLVEFSGFT